MANKLIPVVPDTLYHYTCTDHGHPGIYGSGWLRPSPSTGMVWLTDLEVPVRDALGLTRVSLKCDRGEVRYRVDVAKHGLHEAIVPWLKFRQEVDPYLVADLEGFPGALPRHWFVTWMPVPAVYAPQAQGSGS